MRVSRKTCINIEERTTILNHNQGLAYEGNTFMPKLQVPEPVWREDNFSFKLENVQSYTIENTKDKDILLNVLYEGVVRVVWDMQLVQVLELKFSTC